MFKNAFWRIKCSHMRLHTDWLKFYVIITYSNMNQSNFKESSECTIILFLNIKEFLKQYISNES
jgi:hypothetical protein